MMTKHPLRLFLLRHGNTFEAHETAVQVGTKTDLLLTAKGKEQAAHFAAWLAAEQIVPAAIYAGGLKRQVDTAKLIAEKFGMASGALWRANALTELDYGAWEGLTPEAITQQWPQEYAAWTSAARWPGHIFGNSQEQHLREIKCWLEALNQAHAPGEAVVGVTSNGVIRFFYSLLNKEWQQLVEQKRIDELKVKTGHFCELHLFPNSLQVKRWNTKP